MPGQVDDYISRLENTDAEIERKLLTEIKRQGFDQGCFLRPDPEVLVQDNAIELRGLFDALNGRPSERPSQVDDPYPTGRPTEVIDGGDAGYVILSQRCDLVSGLALEPLIELAAARRVPNRSDEASRARRNSPRWMPVVEDEHGMWIADLRMKALLPKDKLLDYPALQPVPEDDRPELRLRLGQRYTRDAVPDHLVEMLQPLKKVVLKKSNADHAKCFTDFFVRIEDGLPRIYAITGTGFAREEGEDAYHQLEEQLPEDLREQLHGDSGAVHITTLHFLLWRTAIKLDFDEASWDPQKAKPGAEQPTR